MHGAKPVNHTRGGQAPRPNLHPQSSGRGVRCHEATAEPPAKGNSRREVKNSPGKWTKRE
eukprot:3370414-Alexandrium_andersonii.AAC.1